jgi:nucleotide-binding universal stress UspA family protein
MKKFLVGVTTNEASADALALARLLAQNRGEDIVVCTVVSETWSDAALRVVDKNYGEFLDQRSQQALEQARETLGDLPGVRYLNVADSAPSTGLLLAARQQGCDAIVLASSRNGPPGRVTPGNFGGELVHASDLPVILTPRGYKDAPAVGMGAAVSRITFSYPGGSSAAFGAVQQSLQIARTLGVPLRLASFAVRDRQMFTAPVGLDAESILVAAWREQAESALLHVREQMGEAGTSIQIRMADGESWDEVLQHLDWQPVELLAMGSCRLGLFTRLFLGSNASKIVRASPVPVLALPYSD